MWGGGGVVVVGWHPMKERKSAQPQQHENGEKEAG